MGNSRKKDFENLQEINIQRAQAPRRTARRAEIARRKRRRRQWKRLFLLAELAVLFIFIGAGVIGGGFIFAKSIMGGSAKASTEVRKELLPDLFTKKVQGVSESVFERHPAWEENYLTPNEFSRPGESIGKVKNIFVHYTANKGTSAAQNRSYFEQLGETGERSASAHFIIGYDGEIIQCIPLDEIGYAVKTRNYDSISIECCYKQENGQFTQETYDSLLELLDWLLEAYHLDSEDVLRHYDCGGKKCPLYYVEHEDAWEQLKRDLR